MKIIPRQSAQQVVCQSLKLRAHVLARSNGRILCVRIVQPLGFHNMEISYMDAAGNVVNQSLKICALSYISTSASLAVGSMYQIAQGAISPTSGVRIVQTTGFQKWKSALWTPRIR